MNRSRAVGIAVISLLALVVGAGSAAESLMKSRIESRVYRELPNAKGVSANFPLSDIPHNLISDSFKSADIKVAKYVLRGGTESSSLFISAANMSKSQPSLIGSLEVTATIPIATIIKSAGFDDAEVVGNSLQISVGDGGFGKALLVPKYSNSQIYFQLKSVSILGSEIPASMLPSDIQQQIKSKSLRSLTAPKGLRVNSVYLSPKGLSLNFRGSNVQLGNLGSAL